MTETYEIAAVHDVDLKKFLNDIGVRGMSMRVVPLVSFARKKSLFLTYRSYIQKVKKLFFAAWR